MKTTARWVNALDEARRRIPPPRAERVATAPNGKEYFVITEVPDGDDADLLLDDLERRFLDEHGMRKT